MVHFLIFIEKVEQKIYSFYKQNHFRNNTSKKLKELSKTI